MGAGQQAPAGDGSGLNRREFLGGAAWAAATGIAFGAAVVGSTAAKEAGDLPGGTAAAAGGGPPLVPPASGRPVYLADFDRIVPPAAASDDWEPGRWRLMPFETGRVKGVMAVAGQNTDVPELTYPIALRGWHALSIGLASREGISRLEARLKSDRTFSLFTDHPPLAPRDSYEDGATLYSSAAVNELYWKCADLSDEAVILRQIRVLSDPEHPESPANTRYAAWIAYIKAVPLSDGEVREMKADQSRRDTRRLIATHDVSTVPGRLMWFDAGAIRREIEPYRDSDFFRIDWEGGKGDITHYPSKIGRTVAFDWQKIQYARHERMTAVSFKTLARKGIDPFRVALDAAHDAGLEFHASYRPAGFLYPPPRDERNTAGTYWRHPEWRGTDREGRPTPRISYAYPEARRWVVSLLREMAGYPIDGVTLLYNRRPPLVEYEAPVVDGFREKFGKDPRRLEPGDPRWLRHRAEVLTNFMREVRAAMDEAGRRAGRRIQVSAVVMGTEKKNLEYAMDLRAWVAAGAIDWLIPYTSGDDLLSTRVSFADPGDAAWLVDLTRGTSCRVAANLMPREMAPDDYRRKAARLARAGVSHFYFWDTFDRCDFSASWSALRRLGHREELDAWMAAGEPRLEAERQTLLRLGEWNMGYDAAS